jgi:7-cyano-7-deazaguanine synthase
MCCITGMAVPDVKDFGAARASETLATLIEAGAIRGNDSTGVALANIDTGETLVIRAPISGELFVEEEWGAINSFFANAGRSSIIAIGNNRAQPLPESTSSAERGQPVQVGDWVLAHNGTISNDEEIAAAHGYEIEGIDTEALVLLLNHAPEHSGVIDLPNATRQVVGGVAAVTFNTAKPRHLYAFHNFTTLFHAAMHTHAGPARLFSSEAEFLRAAGCGRLWEGADAPIEEVPTRTGLLIDATTGGIDHVWHDLPWATRSALPPKQHDAGAVICSGGLDSVTTAHIAAKVFGIQRLHLLHYHYGHRAEEPEWASVEHVAEQLTAEGYDAEPFRFDLRDAQAPMAVPLTDEGVDVADGQTSARTTTEWVPARNLVMLGMAAAHCEAKGLSSIWSGFNLEESGAYPDNEITFLRRMNSVLEVGTLAGLELRVALERLMKSEIILFGTHLGVDYGRTWSCYHGGEKHCGQCGPCWNRRRAFMRTGLEDPAEYALDAHDPADWERDEDGAAPLERSIEELKQKLDTPSW